MTNAITDSERSHWRRCRRGTPRTGPCGAFATVMVGAGLIGLLSTGCATDTTSSAQTSDASVVGETSTEQVAETSTPPTTEPGTTLPDGPPVFDPQSLGDNLLLPSFILTVTVANTNGGQLSENITSTWFIKDPRSVFELATFSYDGTTDGMRSYLVDGRFYEENQFGDWYLYEAGSPAAPDPSDNLDLRLGTLAGVLSADFVGDVDFAGIAAHHFVFDETDLSSYASYSPEHPSPEVEGDFYLALDGNYVLSTHSKETAADRIYEVTEALSSVGQLTEIILPAELAPMTLALDLGAGLGTVLPPGTVLSKMIRYTHGIGVDYYTYRSTVRDNEEFLNFYRTLPPTNGWTVSHIGHIKPHYEDINCEVEVECVILQNGGEQIVVSFGAGIIVEYDREHVFSAA